MASNGFDGNVIRKELEVKGWCVVPGVVIETECDELVSMYKQWLKQFSDDDWPRQMHSVMHKYNIGHFRATWMARLKTKSVFKEVWQTNKLLTSFDGIALSPPPELGGLKFAVADEHWFHLDQASRRHGIHAYQGALYLEQTTESDYVFRVLENSHNHHTAFCRTFPKAAKRSAYNDFHKLTQEEYNWYKSVGCVQKSIPVPKGGMVLWDSRTIHDNNRPQYGRENADRWRFVVFSCMTPAAWARPQDIEAKRTAYNKMIMTTHWPSQKINSLESVLPAHDSKIRIITSLPGVAKTNEAKLLSGILEYDFEDGESNGPEAPTWIEIDELG